MRNILALAILLAASLNCWSQTQINGIQPSAVNGVTVASGSAFNGLTLTAPGGGGGGGGTNTIVQSKSSGSAGGTSTFALTSPPTVGNILVAIIYQNPGNTLAFTDTYVNTGTQLAFIELAADGDRVALACAQVTATGGGADTVVFSVNGVTGPTALGTIYEIHNSTHTATCTVDGTYASHNSTGATACNSTAMTTSTTDVLFGGCGLDGTATATITAGSGWTNGLNAGNTGHPLLLTEVQLGATAGSYTATSATIPSEEQGSLVVALTP